MLNRTLTSHLQKTAESMPIIALLGPRQSGKTTLAQISWPNHRYVSLEDLDNRAYATSDPRGFLRQYENEHGIIIDEFQNAPDFYGESKKSFDDVLVKSVIKFQFFFPPQSPESTAFQEVANTLPSYKIGTDFSDRLSQILDKIVACPKDKDFSFLQGTVQDLTDVFIT